MFIDSEKYEKNCSFRHSINQSINQYLFIQRICQAVYIMNRQFLKLFLRKYIEIELNLQSHKSEKDEEVSQETLII